MIILNTERHHLHRMVISSKVPVHPLFFPVLLGIGQGFLFPLLLYQTAQACSGEKRTLAIGLVSSARWMAQFIVPYVFGGLSWLFNTSTIRDSFTFSLVALILAIFLGSGMLLLKPNHPIKE